MKEVENHWDCELFDKLSNPDYFSPPIPPDGSTILSVIAFGHSIPQDGWKFSRSALGEKWIRVS